MPQLQMPQLLGIVAAATVELPGLWGRSHRAHRHGAGDDAAPGPWLLPLTALVILALLPQIRIDADRFSLDQHHTAGVFVATFGVLPVLCGAEYGADWSWVSPPWPSWLWACSSGSLRRSPLAWWRPDCWRYETSGRSRHIWPVAAFIPRWSLLLLIGGILLGAGMTWEKRVNDVRTAGRYVRGLS
ncbi:MAG: hypothetical protein ACYDDU_02065 [Dermatophilaceae bacterium]